MAHATRPVRQHARPRPTGPLAPFGRRLDPITVEDALSRSSAKVAAIVGLDTEAVDR